MEGTENEAVVAQFETPARNLPVRTKITKKLRAADGQPKASQPARNISNPTISWTISTTVGATLLSYKSIKALIVIR